MAGIGPAGIVGIDPGPDVVSPAGPTKDVNSTNGKARPRERPGSENRTRERTEIVTVRSETSSPSGPATAVSPARTSLNVGARLSELESRLALKARRCAALGWTDVELDKLTSGADFRDLLRGDARGTWLRGE